MLAFRKNKNLKEHLVRAKIKTGDTDNNTNPIELTIEHNAPIETPVVDPFHLPADHISCCPIRRCFLHKYLHKSLRIQGSITKRSYRVRGKFNCNSKNIIYLIQCAKCTKQYVGQTRSCLRHRISQHINNKSSPNSIVDQHFEQSGHKMMVQPIEQVSHLDPSNIEKVLNERERYWISKLKTVYPQGLNYTAGRT